MGLKILGVPGSGDLECGLFGIIQNGDKNIIKNTEYLSTSHNVIAKALVQ